MKPSPSDRACACQVPGCTAQLESARVYYARRGVCPLHAKADAVCRSGYGAQLWRFCQQCGRLEPLSLFDGAKRSCRASLQRRNQQQHSRLLAECRVLDITRQQQPQSPGSPPAAATRSSSCNSAAELIGASLLASPQAAPADAWALPARGQVAAAALACPSPATDAPLAPGLGSGCLPPLARTLSTDEMVAELVDGLFSEQQQGQAWPIVDSVGSASSASSSSCLLSAASTPAQIEAAIEQELQAASNAVLAARTAVPAAGALPPPAFVLLADELAAPQPGAATSAAPAAPAASVVPGHHPGAAAAPGLGAAPTLAAQRAALVAAGSSKMDRLVLDCRAAWLQEGAPGAASHGTSSARGARAAAAGDAAPADDCWARLAPLHAQFTHVEAALQQLKAGLSRLAA